MVWSLSFDPLLPLWALIAGAVVTLLLTGLSGGERVITHVDEDTINQLSSGAIVAFN